MDSPADIRYHILAQRDPAPADLDGGDGFGLKQVARGVDVTLERRGDFFDGEGFGHARLNVSTQTHGFDAHGAVLALMESHSDR